MKLEGVGSGLKLEGGRIRIGKTRGGRIRICKTRGGSDLLFPRKPSKIGEKSSIFYMYISKFSPAALFSHILSRCAAGGLIL